MSTTKTTIQWTDCTWNVVRGCSLVSKGCESCYAMKQAHRFSGKGKPYAGLTEIGPQGPRWTGTIRLVPEALAEPLRWKKPRRVFVNSMSDLFHEDVSDEFIERVFAVMALARRHTFQVLTKRPERMRQFCSALKWERLIDRANENVYGEAHPLRRNGALVPTTLAPSIIAQSSNGLSIYKPLSKPPLPNVWLGVSIEDQATADARIPILLQTPAAVRFISAEPLLGPVDLARMSGGALDALDGYDCESIGDIRDAGYLSKTFHPPGLSWVIVGGESGPNARPCNLAWIRSLMDQCQAAQVPCFVKQLGARWYDIAARIGIRGSCAVPIDAPWIWITQQDAKGGDWTDTEFPEDLKVREFPVEGNA